MTISLLKMRLTAQHSSLLRNFNNMRMCISFVHNTYKTV